MKHLKKIMNYIFLKDNSAKKGSHQINEYKIGEIVVCIDDEIRWHYLGNLKKNELYTIVGFNSIDGGFILEEVKSPSSGCQAYASSRFRKVDLSFFDEVYSMLTTELDVPINKQHQIQQN